MMENNSDGQRRGVTTGISALIPAPEGMIAAFTDQSGTVFSEVVALAAVNRVQGDQSWSEVVGVLGYRQDKLSFADDFGNFSHYANHISDLPSGTKRLYNQQKLAVQSGTRQPQPVRRARG
jgi:hypothetical protein